VGLSPREGAAPRVAQHPPGGGARGGEIVEEATTREARELSFHPKTAAFRGKKRHYRDL